MSHFAESLKILRQSTNLTMQNLADAAGVSKSMISKIERDEVQPTLDVAGRLAKALGKTLSEMLHASQTAEVVFLPKNQQALWEDASGIKRRNISPVFENLKIEWLHVEIPKGVSLEKCVGMSGSNVKKYVLVTKGVLALIIGQNSYTLKKGDSIYFAAESLHVFKNAGKETLEYQILIKHA
ncbi:MAG TPA: XRE family transcriptional regulator [Gammaproteobacteria bacterium]|nr:XRE family transcriptional regulator [Gammaproteobacteria bacterium]